MALIFMDGLDVYDNFADITSSPNWSVSGTPTFSTTQGRFGGGCIRTDSFFAYWSLGLPLLTNKDYYFSFSFLTHTLPAIGTCEFVKFVSTGASNIMRLSLTPGGTILIGDRFGNLSSSSVSGAMVSNTWCRVEIKLNLGTNSSSGVVEVKINGAVVCTATGLNLWDGGNAVASIALLNQAQTNDYCLYDDIVLNDTTGSSNTGYLGDVRIDAIRPNADQTQADWSITGGSGPGYSAIADAFGSSDGDTSYLSSSTVGNKSEFGVSSLSGSSASIMGVQVRSKTKRTDAGTRTYRNYLKSSSAVINGPTLTPQTNYSWDFGGVAEADPNTSAAWTDSGVNAVKLGLELVS